MHAVSTFYATCPSHHPVPTHMSARSTPPRPPSRNHCPSTSSCRNQRGHSNQHVDQIYRDERERQERLVGQISGWRSDAAVLRAAGDRAGADRVEQMVASMQHLQRFLQQRAPERVFERVNSAYVNEIVIDCHALHANEAVAKVKAAMKVGRRAASGHGALMVCVWGCSNVLASAQKQ